MSTEQRRGWPAPGTVLEVCGVTRAGRGRRPRLRPLGLGVVNHDWTISAWLDATPVGGRLLLRPCPGAPQRSDADAVEQEGLAGMQAVGEA